MGTSVDASTPAIKPSEVLYIACNLPPIPLILDSTTDKENAAATAASNAFPP